MNNNKELNNVYVRLLLYALILCVKNDNLISSNRDQSVMNL